VGQRRGFRGALDDDITGKKMSIPAMAGALLKVRDETQNK
jgi:hypothetical protein